MKYIASTSINKKYKYSITYFAKVIISDSSSISSILSDESYKDEKQALKKAEEMVINLSSKNV